MDSLEKAKKIAEILKVEVLLVCGILDIKTEEWAEINSRICGVKNTEEAWEMFNNMPLNTEAERLLIIRWVSLSRDDINSAKNISEIQDAYDKAFADDEIEELAMKKWLLLCKTPTDAERAYRHTNSDGDNWTSQQAYKKWCELSSSAIEAATKIEEVYEAIGKAPPESSIIYLAIKKVAELIPN